MKALAEVGERIAAASAALGRTVRLDVEEILQRRSRLAGWPVEPAARVSRNGTCRLLPGPDGWLALNLSRPGDVEDVPALLGLLDRPGPVGLDPAAGDDPWPALRAAAACRPVADVVAAARLLGLPAAVLGEVPAPAEPVTRTVLRPPRQGPPPYLTVLDLSALWAGPLCAHLLGRSGFRVVVVEDPARPDGMREGSPAFHSQLRAGHERIDLTLADPAGRAQLHRLADAADVIVEASRPAALHRLGLDAEAWLAAAPGRTWVSITGYGRADPQRRIAFGDDAAVAGGLVDRAPDGGPAFRGDAVADPVTGLVAAAHALEAVLDGAGGLLDAPMAGISAWLAAAEGLRP